MVNRLPYAYYRQIFTIFLILTRTGTVTGFLFKTSSPKPSVEVVSVEDHAKEAQRVESRARLDRLSELDALSDRLVSSGLRLDSNPSTSSSPEKSCYAKIFSSSAHKTKTTDSSYCGLVTESDFLRSAFAARLTICELDQAQLNIPKECSIWVQKGHEDARTCITALHASPQSWSSYSGHLRDAIQLCFGYANLHGLDKAREIYESTTLIANQLLISLRHQEEARQRDFLQVKESITQYFQSEASSIRSATENDRIRLEELASLTRSNLQASQRAVQAHEQKFEDLVNGLERVMIERDAVDRRDRAENFSDSLDRWVSSADVILRGLAVDAETGLSTQFATLQTELSSIMDYKLNHSLQALVSCLELRFVGLAESLGQRHEESLESINDAILIQYGEMANLSQRLSSIDGGFMIIEDRLKGFDQISNRITFSLSQAHSTIVDLEYQLKLVMANLSKELDTQITVVDNLTASLVGSISMIDQTAFQSIKFLFSWIKSIGALVLGSLMSWTVVPYIIYPVTLCASRWLIKCSVAAGLCVIISCVKKLTGSKRSRWGQRDRRKTVPAGSEVEFEDDADVLSQTMMPRSRFGALDVAQRHLGLEGQRPDLYALQRYERAQAIACIKEFNAISTGLKNINGSLGALRPHRLAQNHLHRRTSSRIVPDRLVSKKT
ncbi:hypothetical protein DFH28DRAFT_423404 [Melampsora americana]|nr:hypothetical protein DFH28DRAFT_423404 [Melampsora americana]